MSKASDVFPAPQLPWAKDELAKKGISAETIEYHYGKHHLGYVRKLNDLAAKDEKVAKLSLEELILNAEGVIYNLAAQIWNHNFYWAGMSRNGGGEPSGKLKEQIDADFGSFLKFKEKFTVVAANHFASGWVWLSWDPKNHKLVITEGHDAGNPIREGGFQPLMVIDVWEHAYYIDQRNNRGAYIDVWWECVDWSAIAKRFSQSG
jgi:Fe-Mn family superoxide dismutase